MTTNSLIASLRDAAEQRATSSLRFPDDGEYRVEIPSVETPEAAALAIEAASNAGFTINRISQGSGITLLTDSEIRDFVRIGASNAVEICLFVGPRAPWDGYSAAATSVDGRNVGWRNVGLASLSAALDDVRRAADLGIRSVLISDEGLAALIKDEKESGRLPGDLVTKASALMGIANPIGARVLADLGVDSLNIGADTPIADLAAFRASTRSFLDLYIEAPDGLGGSARYHDLGEIVRVGAPVYIKFGLKNAPGVYPSGEHLRTVVAAATTERVRRARIGLEHLARQNPAAVQSPLGADPRGIPVV